MAQRKNTNASKQQKKKKASGAMTRRPSAPTSGLDAWGAAYARLLRNPCGAELAHPVYSGGSGGYLVRVEKDFLVATTLTSTCSYGWFAPSNMSPTNGATTFGTFDTTSDLNSGSAVGAAAEEQPGFAFLSSVAQGVRCVSACLQVSYPGAELNRSGIVGLGTTTLAIAAGANTAAGMRTLATKVARTPDGVLEVKWTPNDAAQHYVNPNDSNASGNFEDDFPALFYTAAGLPAGVGLRVRLVAVYEWLPRSTMGVIGTPGDNVTKSRNTLNHVINALRNAGDWAFEGFTSAGHAASSIGAAAIAGRNLYRGSAAMGRLMLMG